MRVRLLLLCPPEPPPGPTATILTRVLASETAEDTILFRLPAAYRPRFAEIHGSGGGTSTIVVGRTGLKHRNHNPSCGDGSHRFRIEPPQAALDGVTFRASQAGGVPEREMAPLGRERKILLRRLFNPDQ